MNAFYSQGYLPLLVSTSKPGQNHLSEAAGPVQFGLTFGPLDGALQTPVEKTLKFRQGEIEKQNRVKTLSLVVKNVQHNAIKIETL